MFQIVATMSNKDAILGRSKTVAKHIEDVDGDELFDKKKYCDSCQVNFTHRRAYAAHLEHRSNGKTQRISRRDFNIKSHSICCPHKGEKLHIESTVILCAK